MFWAEKIFVLLMSHLIGDYVLQCDFIANTKAENFYHLFVHCFLYLLPFYLFFGFTWQLVVIFFYHISVDLLKCKKIINYVSDQYLHIVVLLVYFI